MASFQTYSFFLMGFNCCITKRRATPRKQITCNKTAEKCRVSEAIEKNSFEPTFFSAIFTISQYRACRTGRFRLSKSFRDTPGRHHNLHGPVAKAFHHVSPVPVQVRFMKPIALKLPLSMLAGRWSTSRLQHQQPFREFRNMACPNIEKPVRLVRQRPCG